jgi:hypothetical protein
MGGFSLDVKMEAFMPLALEIQSNDRAYNY